MTTISAVITTYLRPRTLSRAIESVTAQRTPPKELLIIDNAGDRETESVVSRFAGASGFPLRYIVEAKRGVSAARNRGIKESVSSYVAFLDDDDVWLPNHLADFIEISHGINNVALFGGLQGRFNNPPKMIQPTTDRLFTDYSRYSDSAISIRAEGPLRRPFFTPSMSASIVDVYHARNTLFDEELSGREDIHFVWRLAQTGKIILHHKLHGLADQLETSLFSVSDGADENQRLEMDLRKVRCGVLMLEKVIAKTSTAPELTHALGSAYFDSAYANALAGNTRTALSHFLRSARIRLERRHLRLALRVAASPLGRKSQRRNRDIALPS